MPCIFIEILQNKKKKSFIKFFKKYLRKVFFSRKFINLPASNFNKCLTAKAWKQW